MIKRLCILCLSVLLVAPAMAQPRDRSSERFSFKPKRGDWQFSLMLGSGTFFKEYNGLNYLLPSYNDDYGRTMEDVGLGGDYGETDNQSNDPGLYLELGASFNDNSIVNIANFQGAYFVTDRIQVNLSFSMDMNLTPKKDYVESSWDYDDDPLSLPNYQYIEGRVSSKMMIGAGGNYYFATPLDRVNLYAGVFAGYQMANVKTVQPYTGEWQYDNTTDSYDPVEIYRPGSRVGMVHGLRGALVAGLELSLMEGLIFGFEIQPASYGYTLLRMKPKGMPSFSASHHNIRAFSFPMLKLGVRF